MQSRPSSDVIASDGVKDNKADPMVDVESVKPVHEAVRRSKESKFDGPE